MPAEVKQLSFRYERSTVDLFSNLSLRFERGITILKGYTGCGKTTLLRLLAGLLHSSGGEIVVSSRPLLVLQEDALLPWLTIRSNFVDVSNQSPNRLASTPLWNLIEDLLDLRAYRLSYGQRRTAELARALAFSPPILLLDEPFNYLDEKRIGVLLDALLDFAQGSNTLVITSHRHDRSLDAAGTVYSFDGSPPFTMLRKETA